MRLSYGDATQDSLFIQSLISNIGQIGYTATDVTSTESSPGTPCKGATASAKWVLQIQGGSNSDYIYIFNMGTSCTPNWPNPWTWASPYLVLAGGTMVPQDVLTQVVAGAIPVPSLQTNQLANAKRLGVAPSGVVRTGTALPIPAKAPAATATMARINVTVPKLSAPIQASFTQAVAQQPAELAAAGIIVPVATDYTWAWIVGGCGIVFGGIAAILLRRRRT